MPPQSVKDRSKKYRERNKEKIKNSKIVKRTNESEEEKAERKRSEADRKKRKREEKKAKPGLAVRASPLAGGSTPALLSSTTTSLAFREEQFATVISWVEERLEEGRGGTMYLWGAPGTGKTTTMEEVSVSPDTRHQTPDTRHPCYQAN